MWAYRQDPGVELIRVDVALGTTFEPWELLDGKRWRSAVRDRLLYEGQHTIAIKTPKGDVFEDEVIEQVLESVDFYARRETGTAYELERCVSSGDGFLEDFARVLNMDPTSISRLAVFDALEERGRHAPVSNTFVLVVAGATSTDYDTSQRLVELMRGQGSSVPVILILYGSHMDLGQQQKHSFDFSRARPCLAARDAVCAMHSEDRWAAYLHHRVAWFVHGHLAAVSAFQPYVENLGEEDDEDLELSFNTFSQDHSAHVESVLWEELKNILGGVGVSTKDICSALLAHRTQLFTHSRWSLLQKDGLLEASLVPWVARAFLLESGDEWRIDNLVHDWLRHHLLCLPLQRGLLGLCLEIDGCLKHLWWKNFKDECDEDETVEKSRDGYDRHSRGSLPTSFPGQALDIGPPFVSLGFVIHHTCTARRFSFERRRPLQEFRTVRNDLAHNHHVGWAQLERVRHCLNSYAL